MISVYKKVLNFLGRMEDDVRFNFSSHPVPYSLVAAVFIVLFWKGIEDTASMFPVLTGPFLIFLSVPVLLLTGVFVSFFITDRVILSGLKKEQKVVQETEVEVKQEDLLLKRVAEKIEEIDREVHQIQGQLNKKR